jgi:hypothetical protein
VSSARGGAQRLTEELRAQGGSAAGALRPDGVASRPGDQLPGPAQLASAGPRAAGHEREYELLLEMIHEGTLLHYGDPAVVDDGDGDLALLLGDQLYAMGLARLAELGDLAAVAELADLISLLAQARAQAADGEADALVAALWSAGATAIGWGASSEHEAAKALARAADQRAAAALAHASRPAR